MPKSAKKQTSRQAIESALASLPAHRAGLPAKDAITAVTKVAGKYTILHTRELDDSDPRRIRRAFAALAPAAPGAAVPAAAVRAAARTAAAVPVGDNFLGKSRKAAKLSISTAKKIEKFKDVKDLVKTLVPDAKMIKHKPPISTGATSKRVKEEERNIHVTAYMYAASRESDNDFHLIIGRAQSATPEMYMTMELSGLPLAGTSLKPLKAARDAFKQFFKAKGAKLPVMTYDYYHPPVPVQIDGSPFFDMTHAKGPHPGPPSLKNKMPTIWEVHPISKIVLK